MKRGEIWTQSGGPNYSGKPRPALVVQSDILGATTSIITCGLTTSRNPSLRSRPRIEPNLENGLHEASEVMIDKIAAVPRAKLGQPVGVLPPDDMARIEEALLLVLGFEV